MERNPYAKPQNKIFAVIVYSVTAFILKMCNPSVFFSAYITDIRKKERRKSMTDEEIVRLYFERDEAALSETESKYGAYLLKVSYNILENIEDSKEKVNDTYMKAWKSIPPHTPKKLSAFLAKITRELSIDEYRRRHSLKRKTTEYALAFDELSDFISDDDSPVEKVEKSLLVDEIRSFVDSLSEEQRNIFVCRYFFFDSIKSIAAYYSMSESNVKTTLYRLREKLKEKLEGEGLL